MIISLYTSMLPVIMGGVFKQTGLEHYNLIYKNYPNTVYFNLLSGALFGFAYMIFELPNSFLKRRFDIDAGSRGRFPVNVFTFVYDQIDSMIGVMLVLAILARLSLMQYILAVILGGITHVLVNMILILFKVRKYL